MRKSSNEIVEEGLNMTPETYAAVDHSLNVILGNLSGCANLLRDDNAHSMVEIVYKLADQIVEFKGLVAQRR